MFRLVCLIAAFFCTSACVLLPPTAKTHIRTAKGAFMHQITESTPQRQRPVPVMCTPKHHDRESDTKQEEDEGIVKASPRTTSTAMTAIDVPATERAEDHVNAFLDKPLFDPWSEPEECSLNTLGGCMPLLERFKQLVREDYNMAEALWAGVLCSLGVSVGMQWVKAFITVQEMPPESFELVVGPPEPIAGYIFSPPAAAAAAFVQTAVDSSVSPF